MYEPYTNDTVEEKYVGQMDDMSDPQYAYYYGMTLYKISQRYFKPDIDYAGLVIYWLRRYISQDETIQECVKECKYIIAKLFSAYPELREEFNNN